MDTFILTKTDHTISNRRVTVTNSITLKNATELSDSERNNRVSFGTEVDDGLTHIQVENALTGEINSVSVEEVKKAHPDIEDWDSIYMEVSSHITQDENNEPALQIDELRAAQRQYGRNV